MIAEWTEEEERYRRFPDERVTDTKPDSSGKIKSILSDEQLKIYEQYKNKWIDFNGSQSASHYLRKYPVTLRLTEVQKDSIYQLQRCRARHPGIGRRLLATD